MKHKHAELIHAWADGAEIEMLTSIGWCASRAPTWDENSKYRLKSKEPEWYENIPLQGVLCWVFNNEGDTKNIDIIISYKKRILYGFVSLHGDVWNCATPLTNDEIKGFLR